MVGGKWEFSPLFCDTWLGEYIWDSSRETAILILHGWVNISEVLPEQQPFSCKTCPSFIAAATRRCKSYSPVKKKKIHFVLEDIVHETERAGFVLPEECKTSKRSYCCRQLHIAGRIKRWQSQTCLGWAQNKEKGQQTQIEIQEIPLKYDETFFSPWQFPSFETFKAQLDKVMCSIETCFQWGWMRHLHRSLTNQIILWFHYNIFLIFFPMSIFLRHGLSVFESGYRILKQLTCLWLLVVWQVLSGQHMALLFYLHTHGLVIGPISHACLTSSRPHKVLHTEY